MDDIHPEIETKNIQYKKDLTDGYSVNDIAKVNVTF